MFDFGKGFKSKIVLPTMFVLVVLTVVLISYMTITFLFFSDSLIDEKIIANSNVLKFHVDVVKDHTIVAAISMAGNQEAIQAIKNRDRETILRIFTPTLALYQIDFYTITDPEGKVLARTNIPDQFGDSIFDQQNIRDAKAGKVSTHYEDGNVIKIAVRTGAPVYDSDGTLVGIISAGVRFDSNERVDKLKKLLNAEVCIFHKDTRIATTILNDGQRTTSTKLDPKVAKIVLEDKQEFFGHADILGVSYKTYYMPLLNPKEEAFAVFFVGNPTSELKAASNTLIRNAILISVIVLIAAMGILFWIISSISTPLTTLASKMDEIGEGHLLTTIGVKGNDEIGHVGTALRKISHTLHKLIDDITGAISEHAKGNIEYHLDTNVFQGDYRLLANRIIELSNVSTKDQLTGLPNRRSFDGRLDVEWTRAMRDQTPLSFLIIDVDRFKTYNDTYGHQQGDVVLKTVAKIMTVPLKRLIDFAARWGGEEFVVLLPNTDSRGAMIVAERIRTQVEAAEIPCHDDGAGKKVTVSIGVCTQIPPAKCCVEKLVSQADAALYRAKETGRNRVCRHED